ncbi:hypothetical protein V8G54_006741 [Vigna mungo]|uniref:Uncharacterized protein n=1 Tax=Vigna mungo TaxID=3915 RepID=A0AAQ3S4V0_VIGMU
MACFHRALPAAVWQADLLRKSHSFSMVAWISLTASLLSNSGSFSSCHAWSSGNPFTLSDMVVVCYRKKKGLRGGCEEDNAFYLYIGKFKDFGGRDKEKRTTQNEGWLRFLG